MSAQKTYTYILIKQCLLFALDKHRLGLLLFFLFMIPVYCFSQNEDLYEEMTVYLNVQGVGGIDAPALIKGKTAYLSISDVFTLLKIKNNPSAKLDSLSGFFINTQDEYLIDRVKNQITFQSKKTALKPDDLILTETNLYMKSNLFGEIFGLNCEFNFRGLTVILTTKLELPLLREMKMGQMRANISRLKGDVKTDTTIGRSYPLFKFGMADWAIATSQQQGMNSNAQVNLSLGSVIAGGEMNVGLHYDKTTGFDSRQQSYLWRYVNNDQKALRQVLVGTIMPQMISNMNGAAVGIQLNNSPTIYRKSFGSYTLNNVTEPGWLVELYVNNVLIDFVTADASGFYKFEVPLVYGISVLMVKMYGQWGEVRTRIENANIPFNFLPPGELEYAVNAGLIQDQPNTKFYRTSVNYGVSRRMSVGGGYEYFSSPQIKNSIPFFSSSAMVFNNLLIAGEYAMGVHLKGSLSYRLPSDLQLEINYTGYKKGQQAILYAPDKNIGVSLALPFQIRNFSSYSQLSLSQSTYSDYKTTNAQFLFSLNLLGISSNVTTTAMYYDLKHINAFSTIAFSFRLPKQFNLMPSAQYDYTNKQFSLMRLNLEKPLLRNGYLNIAYEYSSINKMSNLEIGFRYDFSFMQTGFNSRLRKDASTFSQSARGSLLFDSKTNYIKASNTNAVGRAGLTFSAYLDLNGNGKRDKNEPKVLGLNLRVNGGRIVKRDKDSTIRVIDLIPYTSYLVELDKNSFQSISWRIKNLTLSVFADPNQFKTIEIPVDVMAEASGTVNFKTISGSKGLGRINVCFYRINQTLASHSLTESDGYFSYMGLQPGQYIARLDSNQLFKIKMTASPDFKAFTIKQSIEGDLVEGLDFTLQSIVKDSVEGVIHKGDSETVLSNGNENNSMNNVSKVVMQEIVASGKKKPAENRMIVKKIDTKTSPISSRHSKSNIRTLNPATQITLISKTQRYSIQYIVNFSKPNTINDLRKITASTSRPVIFISEEGSYKVRIVGFSSKSEAEAVVKRLDDMGFQGCIIKDNPDSILIIDKGQRYSIQVGAYNFDKNAISAQRKISESTGLPVVFVSDKGFYKIMMVGFTDKTEADLFVKQLARKGIQSYVNKFNPKY